MTKPAKRAKEIREGGSPSQIDKMNPLDQLQQNRDKLAAKIASYEPDIVQFMRDLIAIPAESCQEGPVIQRIQKEMQKVGFDEITIDQMGNILGRIGSGKHVIMFDSHTDTVGVGDLKEWKWDPYRSEERRGGKECRSRG